MAFGVKRKELNQWKKEVKAGHIAFFTHFWYDNRFPHYHSVTKVGCNDVGKLVKWGKKYGLKPEWIDNRKDYPHFDLMGERQLNILTAEGYFTEILKFRLGDYHGK